LRANIASISHRCHLFEVAFVWELTKEITHLPLGCLQSGFFATQRVLYKQQAVNGFWARFGLPHRHLIRGNLRIALRCCVQKVDPKTSKR